MVWLGTGSLSYSESGWATAQLNTDKLQELAAPFGLDRFVEGRMIDESIAAAVAH